MKRDFKLTCLSNLKVFFLFYRKKKALIGRLALFVNKQTSEVYFDLVHYISLSVDISSQLMTPQNTSNYIRLKKNRVMFSKQMTK